MLMLSSRYYLCVVIWNTVDVPPKDKAITGEEMSDIFVEGILLL